MLQPRGLCSWTVHALVTGLGQNERFFKDTTRMDNKDFAYAAVPQSQLMLSKITRHRGKSSKFPTFVMHIEDGNGNVQRDVLMARRQRHGKCISYLIGTDRECFLSGEHTGKLKSNLKGSEYKLYDDGDKRSRAEIATIVYTHKSWSNPRGLVVRIPGPQKKECIMVNALPEWDPVTRVHSLKFNGRATEVSVKNFKLIKDYVKDDQKQDHQPFLLRMGKVGKDTFHLDFRAPITPLQALGVALTSFEGGRA